MKKLKRWWIRFTNPTPKKWKDARNYFGGVAAGITGGLVAVKVVDLSMPDSTKTVLTVALFIAASLTAYCQSHETNTKQDENK